LRHSSHRYAPIATTPEARRQADDRRRQRVIVVGESRRSPLRRAMLADRDLRMISSGECRFLAAPDLLLPSKMLLPFRMRLKNQVQVSAQIVPQRQIQYFSVM
jgi:hypothetical protein